MLRLTWSPRRLLARITQRPRPPAQVEAHADAGYILHYHIYKNAGSSIDRLLAESFGDGWQAFDPTPGANPAQRADLAAFIAANPDLRAVSSHSTRLAWPGLPHPHACPIVMLRHPIDRVRSVYDFARRDPAQPDHALAASGNFQTYIEARLAVQADRSGIADYQVGHLSEASVRCAMPWFAEPGDSDLEQAIALVSGWPAFGLVRRFAESMRWFEAAYGARVPGLSLRETHENRAPDGPSTEDDAIEDVWRSLGADTFASLIACNRLDLALHSAATSLFQARPHQ